MLQKYFESINNCLQHSIGIRFQDFLYLVLLDPFGYHVFMVFFKRIAAWEGDDF
jgi:hypothetical protein